MDRHGLNVWSICAAVGLLLLTICSSPEIGSPAGLQRNALYSANQILSFGSPGLDKLANRSKMANWKYQGMGVVFVADSSGGSGGAVGIFSQTQPHQMLGEISVGSSFGPHQLAVDDLGELFVADFQQQQVEIFQLGGTSIKTIPIPAGPQGVAVDKGGLFAVAYDVYVAFFKRGSRTPCNTVTDYDGETFRQPLHLAFDGAGNLYVVFIQSNTLGVQKIVGGCRATRFNLLNLQGVIQARDVKVDPAGNLAVEEVDDTSGQGSIDIFPPGSSQRSGTVPLNGAIFTIGGFSFVNSAADMWIAGCVDYPTNCGADKFAYPGGGSPLENVLMPNQNNPYPRDVEVFPVVWPGKT